MIVVHPLNRVSEKDRPRIDLHSDTLTRPSSGMMEAMVSAPLGDDVLSEDPSVNTLEERIAALFGMEAAIFCPSGTMTNQIAVNVHTRPSDTVICHYLSHIYLYEGGGLMANSGVSVRLIGEPDGQMTASAVEDSIDTSDNVHNSVTRLVALENTSNRGGGSCIPLAEARRIGSVAQYRGLKYHLDGARLMNAIVANDEDPIEYGQVFDSISLCLSKGLGCPVGSVLIGSHEFIRESRRVRKRLGGGWRQAGILAAAGIYALDNNIERLHEDHKHAKAIYKVAKDLPWVVSITPPQTNIVLLEVESEARAIDLRDQLMGLGIRIHHMGKNRLRMVTHLDVNKGDVEEVSHSLEKLI